MQLTDSVYVKGYLKIEVFDAKSGRFLYNVADKPNLICKNTKISLTSLLDQSGGNLEYYRLWSIYVGDDNTAPATTQTALVGSNQFGKTTLLSIIPPADSGIIEVEMTLASGEHNNEYLRECALYTRGNTDSIIYPVSAGNTDAKMLARQIHGDVYKTSGITVKYTWRYRIIA